MAAPAQERYSGCLIGQCLGDALGYPVEGAPPEVCRAYVAYILSDWRAGRWDSGNYSFGQYTDDSQLARELLQSYVECRRFDPADYARRIAALFTEQRIVGRGQATTAAALRLAAGIPWDQAGAPPPDAGNGSAMRAAPVGLLFHDDPPQLIRAAHDQGRITHQDPRCSAGAVAIAGAVALALQGGPLQVSSFLDQLASWVEGLEPAVASVLRQLHDWLPRPPGEAVTFIARAGYDPGYADDWRGISPFVTSSVAWSLYCFLKSPGNYWQTICTAIAAGGDVDTTAAMAGAISGAYLGLAALPGELARHLNDRGTWELADLVELAHRAHGLKEGPQAVGETP